MAERMVQKDKSGGLNLKFHYNPSPPGEAEEIMNAVLSGLVKTEHSHHHHQSVAHYNERVPCSATTMMDVSHNYVHQSSRYTPYSPYHTQYYYSQSQPVSPTYYPQHPPFSSNYQSTLSSHSLPSIPSTVYQVQGGSTSDMEGISDEQLDKTLKDLGLLEPSRPKVVGKTQPSHANVHHQQHHLQPSSSCPSLSMCKETQGQPRLYRFIMTLLESSETNPSLIEWVDRSKGMFALVDPNEIARRWGICKNNSCMNYEKMSRGFRYYYKVGILERVPGKKLVYKFSARAPIWNMMSSLTNDKTPGCRPAIP